MREHIQWFLQQTDWLTLELPGYFLSNWFWINSWTIYKAANVLG